MDAIKEVASYVASDQFEPGESVMECGYFTVALNAAAGQHSPLHDAEWIDQQADRWYTEMTGLANTSSNKSGMSLWQLYTCLRDYAGLHYQGFTPSLDWIRGYVKHGYPVVIAVAEQSVFDIGLGEKVPYPWKPSGSHIITVTALVGENFLCRDTAAIKASGELLPQPRIYDAAKLQIISSTAIVLPWLSRPSPGFNPTIEETSPVVTNTFSHEYTIKSGDTLSSIAAEHGISVATLLHANIFELDQTAAKHGYVHGSNWGQWIFPGTVLKW